MNDHNPRPISTNNATVASEAEGTKPKVIPQDLSVTASNEPTATMSISLPEQTLRLARIVAAATGASVSKTIAGLLARAVEREIPGIIRELQGKP